MGVPSVEIYQIQSRTTAKERAFKVFVPFLIIYIQLETISIQCKFDFTQVCTWDSLTIHEYEYTKICKSKLNRSIVILQ